LLIYYQEPLSLTLISSEKNERATKVEKVLYYPDLPEYPETAVEGVAYLINTENMSQEEITLMCKNVSLAVIYL